MRRMLTKSAMAAVRRAVQKFEEERFPDYNIAVAVKRTTDELSQPLVMISRSKKSVDDE